MALGEEPPAHKLMRGKERAGEHPMEYNDWTLQAVITLITGVLATVGLAVAMVFAFIKGEK